MQGSGVLIGFDCFIIFSELGHDLSKVLIWVCCGV